MRFAIVVSKFNAEVTDGLLAGARAYLREQDVPDSAIDVVHAPGAYEIPLIAQSLARLGSRNGRYAGVICLGAVIKGDTAHFEFISLGAAVGIMQAGLATETPITFGILTTYNDEQAVARSRMEGPEAPHNKGREAAAACLETARTLADLTY
jgi:6,7-dimethyl-8-ribityllumazine synthase